MSVRHKIPRKGKRTRFFGVVDAEKSSQQSAIIAGKKGKGRIRTPGCPDIQNVIVPDGIRYVYLGGIVRRLGKYDKLYLNYRPSSGGKVCSKLREWVVANDVKTGLPVVVGSIVTIELLAGNIIEFQSTVANSKYGKNGRAWFECPTIAAETTGSSGALTPLHATTATRNDNADDNGNPDQLTKCGSDLHKRVDYTAGKNQPKATYDCDRINANELDRCNTRNNNAIETTTRPPDDHTVAT